MKPKSLTLMVVAVACGLVASYMTSRLIAENKKTIVVWRAKDDFPQYMTLKKPDDMFERDDKVLKNEAPTNVVFADNNEQIESLRGKPLKRAMKKGDILTIDDVMANGGCLDTALPAGKVAKAVTISPQSAVAGFVVPGTHVDVYAIRGRDSACVLEDILVRAIDSSMERPEDRGAMAGGTATLELDRDQAKKLLSAPGTIELVLRSFEDWGKTSKKEVAQAPPPPAPPPPPPPPPRTQAFEELTEKKPHTIIKTMTVYTGHKWLRAKYTLNDKGEILDSKMESSDVPEDVAATNPSAPPPPPMPDGKETTESLKKGQQDLFREWLARTN